MFSNIEIEKKIENHFSRSLCSLVCKWNYDANPNGKNGWNEDFFSRIGLSDLSENNWKRIGKNLDFFFSNDL